MAQRKISILDKAAEEVAHVAYFIESKGLPETAKKFVDDAFKFFERLGDSRMRHRPCTFSSWKAEGYRCASFKKYIVAYIDTDREVIIIFAIRIIPL